MQLIKYKDMNTKKAITVYLTEAQNKFLKSEARNMGLTRTSYINSVVQAMINKK